MEPSVSGVPKLGLGTERSNDSPPPGITSRRCSMLRKSKMPKLQRWLLYVAIAFASSLVLAAPAHAQDTWRVKVGILTCSVAGGFGYFVGSSREVECNYRSNAGRAERYDGAIAVVGLDLGYLSAAEIVWGVVAPTNGPLSGALAGTYVGARAGVTVGLGAGMNVLTGGFRNSFALQPISIQGNSGLYFGAGFGAMKLQLDRPLSD